MRAVRITRPGGPEVLALDEVARPVPARGELLVAIEAAGVNRADLLQRAGRYPAPAGTIVDVPGLEFAGTIAEVGSDVEGWQPGGRVMGLLAGGGYAQYVAVAATHVTAMPEGWSWEMAAAVPEVFLTAHDALERVRLRSGERVLIHAIGSGVGVALLQLAKAAGAMVAGTSRSEVKLERAMELGLDTPLLVDGPFVPPRELDGWANVICDLVGGPYLAGSLQAAAVLGRLIIIGLTGGRTAEVDLGTILRKRLSVVGTVLRARSADEKAELVGSFNEQVMPLFVAGSVRPVVDRVFPMTAAAEAHRYMEQNRNFGSVVLRWN